ncbi:Oligopeptide-binding protein AppA precursor [Luteitalea pratensis]|uniref:Oligopeptide-binding protein AppA n=1 Tax=Luteitalea pratensis TaxID=1855912 RepID=A0A143PQ98_LUTPR|nr:ABC transporter substrate-binding protein [Luteitalea pratensis]AMY10313.1 Oligopeptide-binding protein AppA precursor [Luteitalea pratensis]
MTSRRVPRAGYRVRTIADALRSHRVLVLLALAVLGGACRERSAQQDPAVIVGIAVGPTNLDPRVGSDEASQRVHQLLYASLVRLDDQLQVVPELAERLEARDTTTFVAHMRAGVRFHDGSALDAEDVAYTFRSFLDKAFLSPRKGAYAQLASVDVEDARTVVFHLKEPFASFPVNLVMGIVPAGTPAGAPAHVGAGPYRFVRMQSDDRVELAPYAGYFEGAPSNAGVILRVIPDDTMRGLELRTGAIDLVINDLAPDIVRTLQREDRMQVVTAPGLDYAYIGMNLRDPLLKDVRVRRALGLAVNSAAIIEHLRRGLAVPATGIIPAMSWANADDLQPTPYDPEEAGRLLDAAGYPDPDGAGPAPRLRLTLKTSTAEFVRLQAAVIQQDLARIGVAVDVRTHEFATLYADVLKGRFQLFTLQWVGVSDPDMLRRVFHSSQMPPAGFNRGFFSDPEVDALIERATTTADLTLRRAQYIDVQHRLFAAAPYVSLWTKVNVAVAQPWVSGVHLTPQASFTTLRNVTKRR